MLWTWKRSSKGETCQLSHYKEEFSSIVKKDDEFSGEVTFKKSDSLLTVKERISEITGFPKEVMVRFGTSGKNNIDENGKSWHYLDIYDVNDSVQIKDSKYNQEYTEDRRLYLWIDIDKCPYFKLANKIQLENDKKFDSLTKKYNYLKTKYNNLNSDNINNKTKLNNLEKEKLELNTTIETQKNQISTLQTEINTIKKNNDEMNTNIQNLKTQNNNLKTELEKMKKEISTIKSKLTTKEENELETKNNEIECKKEFEKNLIKCKEKMTNEYKTEINNIFKIFINSFEKKEKIKNNFSNSLQKHLNNFTKEYYNNYNKIFKNSLEENLNAILNKYNNDTSIENINFIVIGQAGVGKSTLINQTLILDENKKAIENLGQSQTKEIKKYVSEKLKMIYMYDTPGIDSNITHDFIFKKVQEIQSQKNNKNNFILYCITDQHRFNSIDGELIQKIMKLYPFNDLPVIIVILQAYFRTKTNKMKEETKKTLLEFLSKEIADKIEIKDIIAKDMEDHKAKGIPDLLKTAFEIKGKRIYSEKLNNFTQEMNEFKKKNIDTKLNIIKEIISENIYPVENIKNNYSCVVDFFDNTKNNFQNLENIFFNEINEENFETKLKEIFNVIYQKINDETENEEFNNFIKEKLNELKKF